MAASMNISLPETMKSFVDDLVESGGYGTASEYIRELVRRDQKVRAEARLEALLVEGLDSGDDISVNPEFWETLRGKLAALRARRNNT
jgi:antitoxin ParD1/3/4